MVARPPGAFPHRDVVVVSTGDGYAVLTAGLDDGDILRAHERDGEPTWTLDAPSSPDGLERSVLGDDVFVLVSVTRNETGTGLTMTAYD
jgi:hypothetical protein